MAFFQGLTIQKLDDLLKYAATFPDYPKNFTLPSLSIPNYVPPKRYAPLEGFCYFILVLTTVTVGARLYIRKTKNRMAFGLDDWLAIPAYIFTLALIIAELLLIKLGGVGQHVYDLPYHMFAASQTLAFAGTMLYFIAVFFIRISITAFLWRLIGNTSPIKRRIVLTTAILLVVLFLVQVFVWFFAYRPVAAGWSLDLRLKGFKSINVSLEIFVQAIIYVVMDVWLLVLPVHTIWTLQLPLSTRIGVTSVFFFGGIACAGAIAKCFHVYDVYDSWDPTWNSIGFMAGSLIEAGFGMVSCSMPALNYLIVTVLPRISKQVLQGTRFSSWTKSSEKEPSEPKSFKEALKSGTGSVFWRVHAVTDFELEEEFKDQDVTKTSDGFPSKPPSAHISLDDKEDLTKTVPSRHS